MLAIHWGPEDFPSTPIVNESIQRALRSDPDVQVDYFTEYLESDAFSAEAASLALADYIVPATVALAIAALCVFAVARLLRQERIVFGRS